MIRFLTNFVALFGSIGTLFCCALPMLFVVLGAGGVFASMISAVPALTIFSRHKPLLFILSGLMLAMSYLINIPGTQAIPLQGTKQPTGCAISNEDESSKTACAQTKQYRHYIWLFSVCCYVVGLSFAYIFPLIFNGNSAK